MYKGNPSSKSLREIQKALDSASDQKLINKEGYDQIRAAMAKKMKKSRGMNIEMGIEVGIELYQVIIS